jgi:hypothetical protein
MDGVFELVARGVEVRRDTDAGAGTMVDEDLAAKKLGGDAFAFLHIEDDDAAASRGIALTAYGDARLVGELDETRGLANRLGADGFDADLVDDLVAARAA